VSRYAGLSDPYVIPGSSVLKNKLGLKDSDALERAELRLVNARAVQAFPVGKFDTAHLMAHHKQLFSAVYSWAGKARTVSISKGDYRFEAPERVKSELARILGLLQKEHHLKGLVLEMFCHRAAHFYSDINVVHPFREGNGRTQRRFFEQLAQQAGFSLDWKQAPPQQMIEASIRGWEQDLRPMVALFRLVTRELDTR
jgi:cell filamentation protein